MLSIYVVKRKDEAKTKMALTNGCFGQIFTVNRALEFKDRYENYHRVCDLWSDEKIT